MVREIRTPYDIVTYPDIQPFMAYQHLITPMEFGTTHNSSGYYLARETCPYAVLFYCDEGQGTIIHQGKNLYFQQGDTVILPAGTSHILISHPEHPFIAKWIDVSGQAVDNLVHTYGIFTPVVFPEVDTKGLIEAYHAVLISSLAPQEVISNTLLLLTAIVHSCVLPTVPASHSQNQLAQVIKTCIDHHMQDSDVSVSKIADILSLPLPKLTKVFQRAFGIGPHAYIAHQKLNNSQLLLRSTDLPIKAISEAMGFSDSNYFYAFFKKNTGVSPGQFRRKHQNPPDKTV